MTDTPYLSATILARADVERARRVAVALEQENARLREGIRAALAELALGSLAEPYDAQVALEDALLDTDPLTT